ncbi:MAG: molecular chaperone TorD family protein [Actinobacteria bacterium]|nr:molecular chaperone TorD family protein [Actinomycetota bacterium]
MDKLDYKGMAEISRQRGNVWRFLSLIYIKEPTPDLISELRKEDLAESLRELGVVFDDIFESCSDEELLFKLIAEYTRLYIGPGVHIAPYESVYIDEKIVGDTKLPGLMWGDSTVEVLKEYEEYGLKLVDKFRDIPDHIGVELELMSFLTEKEAGGWESEHKENALKWLLNQHEFLGSHLAKWAPKFCDYAAEDSRFEFYKSLAVLTKEYILSEYEYVNDFCSSNNSLVV